MNFQEIIILDGATGTELHKLGLKPGVCPEEWILNNPDAIKSVQSAYQNAGSDAIYAPTFGANRKKLPPHLSVYETNLSLLKLCREAVGNDVLIGGDISPTGELLYPMGMMTEAELVQIYEEQIQAFYDFGVDFIVIETMMDIREVKCALLAKSNVYKEKECPVLVTVTLEESGKMLTGTDPLTAMLISEEYGASAFGFNCSCGPDKMIPLIDELLPYASVPLIAKPNAGLPHEENGKTVFSMEPKEFKNYVRLLVEHGVNLIGGCCGTTPEYIKELSTLKIPVMPVRKKEFSFVCSCRSTVVENEETKKERFILTDEVDPQDFIYDLADASCELIELEVQSSDETLTALLEQMNFTVTPPIRFQTQNETQRALLRLHNTGAQSIK